VQIAAPVQAQFRYLGPGERDPARVGEHVEQVLAAGEFPVLVGFVEQGPEQA